MAEVALTIDLSMVGNAVEGVASLHAASGVIEAKARAVRHDDGSIDGWACDLVTARLLRKLEVALMETVHERIDRAVAYE
ncbi:MAG TPA: hypothetical protein VLG28_11095 [Acidimicrobiia bacterium]|jgi:hypothetical protein|nr:hypothetical protein [Acidimicrobiia bacterium]